PAVFAQRANNWLYRHGFGAPAQVDQSAVQIASGTDPVGRPALFVLREGGEVRRPGLGGWAVLETDPFSAWIGVDQAGQLQVTYTPIGQKWREPGVQAILGQPTSGEIPIASGRMANFQGGSVYWSEATGAHVVYGAIGGYYHSLSQAVRN